VVGSVVDVTLVEASPAYLEVGRREIEARYGSAAQCLLGDFVQIAEDVPAADVVTLDRVVCCYPDFEAMLSAAAARARRLLGLTYPRNRWYVRAFFALGNFLFQVRGSRFRAFVHPPERMQAVLEAAGLVRTGSFGTFLWEGEVYCRRGGAESGTIQNKPL
jgi:hypothetical protein